MAQKELDYAKVRRKLKDGDILLYKGSSLFSWFIKKITRSEFSHSGIVVRWNNRLMVMEARDKRGVLVQPLSRSVCYYRGTVVWYTSKKKLSKKDRRRMVEYAELELGKSYKTGLVVFNLVARLFNITGAGTPDVKTQTDKQFCSYYVAQIYNSIGLDLTPNKNDCFMSPDDIANSKVLRRIGILRTYSKETGRGRGGPCEKYAHPEMKPITRPTLTSR